MEKHVETIIQNTTLKDDFPEEFNKEDPDYELVHRKVRGDTSIRHKYETGKILPAKIPNSPIKGIIYGSSFPSDLITSKFIGSVVFYD